jgi:hypothetical protein
MPNKSPEPTAIGAGSSAIAVHVASWRWLSFFMRIALFLIIVAATSLLAWDTSPQSATFIGRVVSIEKSDFGMHWPSPQPWKAVVKIESVEKLWLWYPATNLTDEVSIFYAQQDLLNTNRSYEFTCFSWGYETTNRLALTVLGGKVTPR